MEKFSCPNCKTKVSFKELFVFKRDHQTLCKKCNTTLKPRNIKSFNFGVIIGIVVSGVHAQLYLHFKKDIFGALTICACLGVISILLIALYTYKTTEFEEV